MSTRTLPLVVLSMAILLAGLVFAISSVDDARHELYRANHQVLICQGLRIELSTDSTDAHRWAKDHCALDYDFPANQDFDPKA